MTFDMRSGNLHWNNILTGVSSLRRLVREVQPKIQTNCQLFFPLWRLETSHPSYTLDSNERHSTQRRKQPCFYWARGGKIHSFFLIVAAKFLARQEQRAEGDESIRVWKGADLSDAVKWLFIFVILPGCSVKTWLEGIEI